MALACLGWLVGSARPRPRILGARGGREGGPGGDFRSGNARRGRQGEDSTEATLTQATARRPRPGSSSAQGHCPRGSCLPSSPLSALVSSFLAMSDAYIAHRIIRRIAGWAVVSFFTEIHVVGGENVPKDGPIIV